MTTRYIGLDWGICSPGMVCMDEAGNIQWMKFFAHKKKHEGYLHALIEGLVYPIYENDVERFHKICSIAMQLIHKEILDGNEVKVCIEGYSFGSTGSRLFQIAENCGMMKYMMWQDKIDFTIAPPTVIKKFATGKGNANKDLVYAAFLNKYKMELHTIFGLKSDKAVSPIADLADATFMAEYRRIEDGNV